MSAHNASIVETLLKWGAKANARTNFMYKVTPLHLAVRNEKCPLSVVEVLLRYGADTSAICSFGNTPLMLAAKYRDDKVLEELLVKGADPNQMSGFVSALHFAALNQSSNANILKTLIQYGGNINIADPSVGITPLLYILRKDYKINQVKELLRNGATLQFADERLSPLRIVLKKQFFQYRYSSCHSRNPKICS
ncbi:unnamed protein product [Larinioides sclopetarius]|uniref:Ankyrin repeat protein n=1 Tax=Larinioides sclopetarius TaxID=280406 RepID=A0AAV2C0U2_9ARAC